MLCISTYKRKWILTIHRFQIETQLLFIIELLFWIISAIVFFEEILVDMMCLLLICWIYLFLHLYVELFIFWMIACSWETSVSQKFWFIVFRFMIFYLCVHCQNHSVTCKTNVSVLRIQINSTVSSFQTIWVVICYIKPYIFSSLYSYK